MDRDKLRPVVLALLCVLAIGAAAATLDSTVSTDSGGGFGAGPPDGDAGLSNGSGSGSFASRPGAVGSPIQLPCYPVLNEPWVVALVLAGFALGGYAAYRRYGGLGVVAYAGPVGIPLVFVHALLTACATPDPRETEGIVPGAPENVSLPGGSGGAGSGSATTLTDPSVLLLVGLGVALVAAVALLFVSSGDDAVPDEPADPAPDPDDVAAVGRAAGEAADRIEASTDVANEVYRAWREMTRHLDVANPRSSTPAEFASAAVAAGMAREDVDELTALFEEVRYGGESPTDERERRAVAALRNIEREYADGGGRGGDADADGDGGGRR